MALESLILYSGYLTVTFFAYKLLAFIWFMLRCYVFTLLGFTTDLKKYGEWVVVTGATDGIGKQYARQFAKRGLKVVLISRSEEKLNTVQREIENEFNVEIMIIPYDFTYTDGYDVIEEKLKGLDIGVLVNNVAMGIGEELVLFENNRDITLNQINVNIVSDVMMTHIVLPGMLKRQRGAIIHIGSSIIFMDLPMMAVYPPTKAFMKKFYQLLDVEHGDVVHHQLVMPAAVSTNMSRVPPSLSAPLPEDFAASAVRTIGVANVVLGYWVHELQGAFVSHLPLTRGMNWAIANHILREIGKNK